MAASEPTSETEPPPDEQGQNEKRSWYRGKQRQLQFGAALIATGGVAWLAVDATHWPFDESPQALNEIKEPSLWDFVLSDRVTVGFVRLGLVLLAGYVIVSVPALVIAGRWLRALGTGGITADRASETSERIERLERQLDRSTAKLDEVTQEREEAKRLARLALQERNEAKNE